MKNFKNLIFLPLGISISSLVLYMYNIIYYKLNKTPVTLEVQKVLKIYLFITILCAAIFIIAKLLYIYLSRRKNINIYNMEEDFSDLEKKLTKEVVRCKKCNQIVDINDNYCKNCGNDLSIIIDKDKIKNIINVIEIVVLALILYLLIMFMFEYKSTIDSNFKIPIYFRLLK